LSLAYFGFRRGLPLSFRSVFYPLVGDRVHGRFGDFIDILAVCATLFGLATSLGLGAKQVNAGLNYVFGLPQTPTVQVVLIACITTAAVASLISGLEVGIRRLSELNMGLAGFLLAFLFIAGPTIFLLSSVVENLGTYIRMLPTNSFWTATYEGESRAGWFSSWTVFYWGWWIAWSPFVGMFIARVSKGRTIREFILGVLLVPSLVSVIWMTGFGTTALHQEVYAQLSSDPESIEKKYGYEPEEYDVQVLDPDHGLPMTADREHLVVADDVLPVGVLAVSDGDGNLLAADDTPIAVEAGIIVNRETGERYRPGPEARFTGTYAARKAELTLAGFLSQPVLNKEHTATMDTTATCMFVMLNAYPLASLTAIIGTLSIILFFITSSDSASMVADIIASGGNQNPPLGTRLFWGILEGILAAVLLLAGGLEALQTGSITVGLPFCIVILFMCFSLYRGLAREKRGELPEEQLAHVMSIQAEQEDDEAATTTE
jgi:choline-glycine betaine transporter